MKNQIKIVKDIAEGMIGIGGIPSNGEFYAEFDMRLMDALNLGVQYKPIFLNSWFNKASYKKITLFDNTQDVLIIWVAENGEVLHTSQQAARLKGEIVNLEDLSKKEIIELWNNESRQWDGTMLFIATINNLKT